MPAAEPEQTRRFPHGILVCLLPMAITFGVTACYLATVS